MSDKKYWATLPTEEVGSEILKRVDDFYIYLQQTGRHKLWEMSYFNYFRAIDHFGSTYSSGEVNQYTNLPVNQFRNLIQHLLVMTTSQRPTFQPMAINNDYQSQAQVLLAKNLLEYYQKEKKIELHIKKAVEDSLIYGDAFVSLSWDSTLGQEYGLDEKGKMVKDGDVEVNNHSPLRVIYDFTVSEYHKRDWIVICEYKNKYDLAAKFKKRSDDILEVGDSDALRNISTHMRFDRQENDDLIPVYKFYHKPTIGRPGGRYTELITPELVLIDTPLPYKDIPVYRISPNEQSESPFGYSPAFDLLPLQEAIDGLNSTIMTNIGQFGVQSVLVPEGSNISHEELGGGLSMIEYDPNVGVPSPLQLTATSPEVYNYLNRLNVEMETLSGVNSVTRGNPESSLKSGAALALVQSMAIQFNSGLQQSYAQLLENVGTGLINILKTYASTPRLADIAGKDNAPYMAEWKSDDIQDVSRVLVDLGNPLSQTLAGKMNMAEMLIGMGSINQNNPDALLEVMETGRMDSVTMSGMKEATAIKSENEFLKSGEKEVNAIPLDKHSEHINEHRYLLSDVDARENPELITRVLNHIQQHIDLLRNTDPGLLVMIGEQPIPPIQQQPGMPPQQEMGGTQGLGEALNAQMPGEQAAQEINLPSMPENPLSGEEFNVITGGM